MIISLKSGVAIIIAVVALLLESQAVQGAQGSFNLEAPGMLPPLSMLQKMRLSPVRAPMLTKKNSLRRGYGAHQKVSLRGSRPKLLGPLPAGTEHFLAGKPSPGVLEQLLKVTDHLENLATATSLPVLLTEECLEHPFLERPWKPEEFESVSGPFWFTGEFLNPPKHPDLKVGKKLESGRVLHARPGAYGQGPFENLLDIAVYTMFHRPSRSLYVLGYTDLKGVKELREEKLLIKEIPVKDRTKSPRAYRHDGEGAQKLVALLDVIAQELPVQDVFVMVSGCTGSIFAAEILGHHMAANPQLYATWHWHLYVDYRGMGMLLKPDWNQYSQKASGHEALFTED